MTSGGGSGRRGTLQGTAPGSNEMVVLRLDEWAGIPVAASSAMSCARALGLGKPGQRV